MTTNEMTAAEIAAGTAALKDMVHAVQQDRGLVHELWRTGQCVTDGL